MNEEELIQETRRLIGRWDNVRIVGQGWAGDARRGFQFNPIPSRSGSTTTPVTTSGACCPEEGDCFIATQAICEAGGGTYQGDNTTCDPDPCPPKGACCVGTDCAIETETDCTGMGGTYQGDDTVCDPNPCEMPTCACGFDAFDGSGRKFLTLQKELHHFATVSDCTLDWTYGATETINPDTCEITEGTCSGTGTTTDGTGTHTCSFGGTYPCSRSGCGECFSGSYCSWVLAVVSATVMHGECSGPIGDGTGGNSETWTLSDECTPI